VFVFWTAMTSNVGFLPDQPAQRDSSPLAALTRRPPEALLYFNPFLAQLDVICGTETGFGGTCGVIAAVDDQGQPGNVAAQGFGVDRDSYWPKAVAAMLVAALVLVVLAVQMVSPTRRWRRPRRRRRPVAEAA
jgi:hypothetical protein